MIWNAKNGSVPLDGTEMQYVSFGRGSRTLVLLPGLADGLVTVKGKALFLAKPYAPFFEHYTVYMFSRRDALPEGYSIRDMAEDQARALGLLGIGKAAVMGVSQGGMIAQYLAIDHPALVEALVLAVTAPYANDIIQDCVGRWIRFAEQGDHRALMIDTAERGYSPAYLKKLRLIYPVIGAVGRPASYGRFLVNARAILQFNALEEVRRIACPTLVLGGGEDRTVGIQGSHELHEGIKDSTLYVYPGLGHGAYAEAKDFNLRVLRFLEAQG